MRDIAGPQCAACLWDKTCDVSLTLWHVLASAGFKLDRCVEHTVYGRSVCATSGQQQPPLRYDPDLPSPEPPALR
ncbi:hypothetical protein AAFF_G00390510 [Aldrovandia affinis]|uniref:Uncharacterized protein n=1 Tax=Aldrovandia affinis TaxID=143900 RepID=A0AAD7SEG6_9TELE|nr:hypothetical protein AAFF_G00390510 [Aldrovandia affinis]